MPGGAVLGGTVGVSEGKSRSSDASIRGDLDADTIEIVNVVE